MRRRWRYGNQNKLDPASDEGLEHHGSVSKKPPPVRIRSMALVILGFSTCMVLLKQTQTTTQSENAARQAPSEAHSTRSRRFPRFGTAEFTRQCNWTFVPSHHVPNCTFFYTPRPTSSEGIADWVSQIAKAFISTRAAGCHLMFDYGKHIDMQQVIQPFVANQENAMIPTNWTVPSDFVCSDKNKCVTGPSIQTKTHIAGVELPAKAIKYRMTYQKGPLRRVDYLQLEQLLVGLQVETAMACALGSLMDLSPRAVTFQPNLFTEILPTIRNERALTIALYIRTGHTDQVAKAEAKGKQLEVPDKMTNAGVKNNQLALDCALSLEQEYLTAENNKDNFDFDKVVWMVVTDLPPLKQYITETYHDKNANDFVLEGNLHKKYNDTVISRHVVSTTSQGAHSKRGRNPSTADFAEALMDWYLVGESDLVVTSFSWYTFGGTAALRTARPFYDGRSCTLLVPVDNNVTLENDSQDDD